MEDSRKPFISVVMPVYNAQRYLKKSISSVLNQSFQNLELILVNDCSTDESSAICHEFEEKDQRVHTIDLERNEGAGRARNHGISKAQGHYLAFVDSDDILPQDIYEKAAGVSDSGSVDLVVWGLTEILFDNKNRKTAEKEILASGGVFTRRKQFAEKILELEEKTLLGYQWNKLYKKEIIEKNGILSENTVLYEDFFFSITFCRYASSVAVLECSGYNYCKRFNGNVTSRYVPEYYSLSRRRVEEMFLFCREEGIQEEAVDVLGNIFLRYILSALVRFYDSEKPVTVKESKCFLEKVNRDQLFRDTSRVCTVQNKFLKMFRNSVTCRRYNLCLCMGRMVYYVKKLSSSSFEKIKLNQRKKCTNK